MEDIEWLDGQRKYLSPVLSKVALDIPSGMKSENFGRLWKMLVQVEGVREGNTLRWEIPGQVHHVLLKEIFDSVNITLVDKRICSRSPPDCARMFAHKNSEPHLFFKKNYQDIPCNCTDVRTCDFCYENCPQVIL